MASSFQSHIDRMTPVLEGRLRLAFADLKHYELDEISTARALEVAREVAESRLIQPPVLEWEQRRAVKPRQLERVDRDPPEITELVDQQVFIPFRGDPQIISEIVNSLEVIGTGTTYIKEQMLDVRFALECRNSDPKCEMAVVLEGLRDAFSRVHAEACAFNDRLEPALLDEIAERQAVLSVALSALAELSIPLRRRPASAAQPLDAPSLQRKASPRTKTKEDGTQETWSLPEEEYEHILTLIESLSVVICRSPGAFARLREENIRDLILLILNSHYEGMATGETFSFSGRTDIFIKVAGKHAFIAECKFWKGRSAYLRGIDQLLGYVCWHDARAALIVFNKSGNTSAMIRKARAVTVEHEFCEQEQPSHKPHCLHFRFRHPRDNGIQLHLAVIVIDTPAAKGKG